MGGFAKTDILKHRSFYTERWALTMDHVSVENACLLSTAIDMTNEEKLALPLGHALTAKWRQLSWLRDVTRHEPAWWCIYLLLVKFKTSFTINLFIGSLKINYRRQEKCE